MKQLVKYIHNLLEYYKFYQDISQSHIPADVEFKINDYIRKHYKRVKRENYITVTFDGLRVALKVDLNPQFEKELEKHYPEKLI